MDEKYFYSVSGLSTGPTAVDCQKMAADGWTFSPVYHTGESYQIPGMTAAEPNPRHNVTRKDARKGDEQVTLESHWYGGINSGGEYWIEVTK